MATFPGIVQRSFAGGEISEELLPRQEVGKVASGLRTMVNFWSRMAGGAENRPGWRHIQPSKDQANHVVLKQFAIDEGNAYAIEMGANYARFFRFAEGAPGALVVDDNAGSDTPATNQIRMYPVREDDGLSLTVSEGGAFGNDAGPSMGALPGSYDPFNVVDTGAGNLMRASGPTAAATTRAMRGGAVGNSVRKYYASPPGFFVDEAWDNDLGSTFVLEVVDVSGSGFTSFSAQLFRASADAGTIRGQSALTAFDVPGEATGVLPAAYSGPITATIAAKTWEAGAATDILVLMIYGLTAGAGDSDDVYWEQDSVNTYLDSGIVNPGTDTADVPYWDSVTQWLVGECVKIPSLDEYRRVFYLADTATIPTPTGITSQSGDAHGSLLEKPREEVSPLPAAPVAINVTPTLSVTEVQSFITEAGEVDGWTWPVDPVRVSLNFEADTGPATTLNVSVALAIFDSSNDVQVEGTFTATQNAIAGGTFEFDVDPAAWGTPATDDRFGILVKYLATGPGDADIDINTRISSAFVDVPAIYSDDGTFEYHYCRASHSDKSPAYLQYHTEFWYPQTGTDPAGNVLLEIPTPYASTVLSTVLSRQSGDYLTQTHRSHTPHELVKYDHDQMRFGRWTMLPLPIKPSQAPPVSLTATDFGLAGERLIRYKVTAINRDSGAESVTAGWKIQATVPVLNPASLTDDLQLTIDTSNSGPLSELAQVGPTSNEVRALFSGDEIVIVDVVTQDGDRAHQHAVEHLEGTEWVIDVIDATTISLRGSAGLLTTPGDITLASDESYPALNLVIAKAYIEFLDVLIPRGTGSKRIAFSWTDPGDAKEFWIYRYIASNSDTSVLTDGIQKWGFLDSTTELTYADEGGAEDNTAAQVDEEFAPLRYRNPFTYGNWPRASAYHQQRQWFGGTDSAPLRLLGSVAGDFRNFGQRSPIRDDDGMDLQLTANLANEVQLMATLGGLMVFTAGGVASPMGDFDGAITPDNPNVKWLSSDKCALVDATNVKQSLVFVHSRKSTVSEIVFNSEGVDVSGEGSRDLTVFARHLFDGYTIRCLALAEVPQPIVWAVRSDGALLGMTYLREQQVWAWHRHPTAAEGKVLWVVTVPEQGSDALWGLIERKINGTTVYNVERMDVRRIGYGEVDQRLATSFMDAMSTYDGTNADGVTTLTLSGGTTWAAGETGLTLTATGGTPFPGDASNVDNGYRLFDADGNEVEVIVTTDGSTTVQTVTLLTACPSGLQAVASTLLWVKMLDDMTISYSHLEGETVGVVADGHYLGTETVASGAISKLATVTGLATGANLPSNRPYGIVHVGLLYPECKMETLDADRVTDDALDKRKLVRSATVHYWNTRSAKVGRPDETTRKVVDRDSADDTSLQTGKNQVFFNSDWDDHGRIIVEQDEPLPVTVTTLVTHIEYGERK